MAKERQVNINKLLLNTKTPFSFEELSEKYNLGLNEVKTVFDELIEQGYRFVNIDGLFVRTTGNDGRASFDASKMFRGGLLHFGLISDTHLSSKFERLDALEAMYDRFDREGIKLVFHCGDLTDGFGVYKGQEFELKHLGQEDQINHVIRNYPKRSGITTVVIGGNHDLKMYEKGGCDPLIQVTRARRDIAYIGQYSARVKMGDMVTADMLHPTGSQAYALSYRSQRMINAMSPEDLPNMLFSGHYHCSFSMRYRGVDFVQVPCFKDPSPNFEKRLGLVSTIGGWIIDGKSNGEVVREFNPRLVTFANSVRR